MGVRGNCEVKGILKLDSSFVPSACVAANE
jgi:hypothetical protein